MSTADLKDDLRKRLESENHAEDVTKLTLPDTTTQSRPRSQLPSSTAHKPQLQKPINGTLDLSNQPLNPSTILFDNNNNDSMKIITLKLTSTSLTHFPITLLTHPSINQTLTHLDLSHNPLNATTYLSESIHLPSLKSLNIVSTGLTSLTGLTTFLSAPNLTTLNISCHRLSGPLPTLRTHYQNLTTLLATDNWFSSISVSAVRGLEVLDVRNNEIDHLPPHIGMLGFNHKYNQKRTNNVNKTPVETQIQSSCLRTFETSGNKFRVPRREVVERGTDAVLADLRRMVPAEEVVEEWRE